MSDSPDHQSQHQDRVRDYFDQEAIDYSQASDNGLWNFVRQRERRVIMDQLAPRPDERILDAGCGTGYYSEWLLRAGARVTASDYSPAMVSQVRARLGIEAIEADLCDVSFDPVFDKVLCAGALEFVPHPEKAISNLVAALNPETGGRIVLHLPRKSFAGKLYQRFHRRHGFEVTLFHEDEIRSLLINQGGLTIDTCKRVTFNFVISASSHARTSQV